MGEDQQPHAQQDKPEPKWGDSISRGRQVELQAILDAWNAPEADHGERIGPFHSIELLTGADVSWLAEQSGRDNLGYVSNLHLEGAYLSGAHLKGADLSKAHLEGANLSEAHLKGADLSEAHLEGADLGNAHLEGAYLGNVHLEDATLRGTHLEGATLSDANLEGAHLSEAHLERANLSGAHLEGANLGEAHLEAAYLGGTHLEGADLNGAHLEGADLSSAHLEGADLSVAHLEGATLNGTHLEGAILSDAHLEGKTYAPAGPDHAEVVRIRQWIANFPDTLLPADLRGAVLDSATSLSDITLGDVQRRAVRVADVRWGGANLAVVDWTPVIEPPTRRGQRRFAPLGDERTAWEWKPEPFTPPPARAKSSRQELRVARSTYDAAQARERLDLFRAAVRANRQLATALRDQGMNEEADHFAYRAQVVQRAVFRQRRRLGRWLFSGFLDLIAGYGYRPQRSAIVYLLVIAGFTLGYWLVGPTAGHSFAPDGALVFSLTSFHGRGFFPGGLELENWITRLAALEAVIGLIIEISLIATFTQRFFGK
jgi:uncharacterized protein YjbI with pentapeptide repeats